jgi:EAL domain-containing protein (putative c-di-GMP-specific phosphodiesterase class I)
VDEASAGAWYLEGFAEGGRRLRIPLQGFPFNIGRVPGQPLTINHADVSGRHAEIHAVHGVLSLWDLDSTNGTFLNRERLGLEAVQLQDGDVLHFASHEYRLGQFVPVLQLETTITASLDSLELPQRFFHNLSVFRRVLRDRDVVVVYQPIVSLDAERRIGACEALGRVDVPGLPSSPIELFKMARQCEAEAEFSRVLRDEGAARSVALPASVAVFLNTSPAEMGTPALLQSLRNLRARMPEQKFVLEIHESSVTEPVGMRAFHASLVDLDIGLAYDDFGAGQARLVELVDSPPDVIKFDKALSSGLHRASSKKRKMVRALVAMVRDVGITALAEGIETEEEIAVCADLGFQLGQGWALGKPCLPYDFPRG